MTPHVVYDARFSLGHSRGMGRFLRALIAGHEQEFLGLCARGENDPALLLHALGPSFYPLWEQFALPRFLSKNFSEIFLAPYNTAPLALPEQTRLILVLHDLIYMDGNPLSASAYQSAGRVYRRMVVPQAIARADCIIAVSEATARELHAQFAPRAPVCIIPNTIQESWFLPHDTPRRPFVLMVTGEAPSKNLARGLASFALYRRQAGGREITLKIAGVREASQPRFAALSEELGIRSLVEFLPYIDTEELQRMYRETLLLLLPSLQEGFGIPALEAMACGTPVAASSLSSLHEVCGEAACYFDPESPEQIATALQRMLRSDGLLPALASAGITRAKQFHPQIVQQTIDSFWREQLAHGPRRDKGAA